MTDKLHNCLESNDPVLYRIKHQKHMRCKIKIFYAMVIANNLFALPCSQMQQE